MYTYTLNFWTYFMIIYAWTIFKFKFLGDLLGYLQVEYLIKIL